MYYNAKRKYLIITCLNRAIGLIAGNESDKIPLDICRYTSVVYLLDCRDHDVADIIRKEAAKYADKEIKTKIKDLLADFSKGEEEGRTHCVGKVAQFTWEGVQEILEELTIIDSAKKIYNPDPGDTTLPYTPHFLGPILTAAGYSADVITKHVS